ncbi:dockerin type I repeat-containing protein, partial [bacterium]|nr:dockerin type I repeat-containing protein [candidate division CSSED10-310 bacterium]
GGVLDLMDCLIAENQAAPVAGVDGRGGGVAIDASAVSVTNCTVAGNAVSGFSRVTGGGIAVTGNGSMRLTDSICRLNTAPAGADMQVGYRWSSARVDALYCNLAVADPDAVAVAPGSVLETGAGIQDADPLFVHEDLPWQVAATGSGQPETSPCIDAGSRPAVRATYLTPETIEILGRRTVESGAFPDQGWVDLGWHAAPLPCVHNGDVDGDGIITSNDVALIFSMALFPRPMDYASICAADMDWNADITAADAQAVARCITIRAASNGHW